MPPSESPRTTIVHLLQEAGVRTDGLDAAFLDATSADAEARILELRRSPGFTGARPAFSVWPELNWRPETGSE